MMAWRLDRRCVPPPQLSANKIQRGSWLRFRFPLRRPATSFAAKSMRLFARLRRSLFEASACGTTISRKLQTRRFVSCWSERGKASHRAPSGKPPASEHKGHENVGQKDLRFNECYTRKLTHANRRKLRLRSAHATDRQCSLCPDWRGFA